MKHKLKVLYIVNKKLPPGDYRMVYRDLSNCCTIKFGMPDRTKSLPEDCFAKMNFGEGFHFRYFLDFARLLFFLLSQKKELDLVHFYTTNLVLVGPLLASVAGIPSVITLTGFGRTFTNQNFLFKILKPIYLLLLKGSIFATKRVFFQNHADMEYLNELYPGQKRKFFYVGSAVSMQVVPEKDFSVPQICVFLATRIIPEKGIYDFLQVAANLPANKFKFVLAGPQSIGFDETYKDVISAHQQGRIEYRGELDADAITREFCKAHILFYPSTYGEGLSRVMLEAGFSQTCPLAYGIPSNKDLIKAGQGYLLSPGDLDAIIKIFMSLEKDRGLLEENAVAYQKFIIENYSPEVYAHRMDSLLEDFI